MESFVVTGLSIRTQNSEEFNENTAKLPGLWNQVCSSVLSYHANLYGVYSDYESDANGLYTVTVGIASEEPCPKFGSVAITAGKYLVFHGKGSMPATVIETWKQVWDYFTEEGRYQRCFMTDFEAYRNGDEVDIYIGIR